MSATHVVVKVVAGLRCPRCHNGEEHPHSKEMILIRGFKVCDKRGRWWSQCLVCSGYYNPLTLAVTPDSHNPEEGWFV
jgi:hypothetical protein